jgi:hypothetical protein
LPKADESDSPSPIAALLSTRSEVFVRRNIPNATGTKHTRHPTPCLLALFVRIKFFYATCFRQVFHKIFEIFFAIEVGAQRSTLDDIDAHVAHQRMT